MIIRGCGGYLDYNTVKMEWRIGRALALLTGEPDVVMTKTCPLLHLLQPQTDIVQAHHEYHPGLFSSAPGSCIPTWTDLR
jgi:hypothetical protein